jgi:hypothetical protein
MNSAATGDSMWNSDKRRLSYMKESNDIAKTNLWVIY